MTLVSWRRPNCHVTECHMTLQVSHDTSVTVTFEVSHDAPPEPVMALTQRLIGEGRSKATRAPDFQGSFTRVILANFGPTSGSSDTPGVT